MLSRNDSILLASLLYSCIDLLCEWHTFGTCCRPVHHWLLVSYVCVIGFRVTHLLGARATAAGGEGLATAERDFLLALRHKGVLPRLLVSFTWGIALPFFALWTLLGTFWLWRVVHETPQCMPSATQLWFSGFWLALCYLWILLHGALGAVAWVLERRVRRAEADLREIEDEDVVSRWGHVSSLTGYQALPGPVDAGLAPSEIRALPCEMIPAETELELGNDAPECPICICELQPGEQIRRLPGCSHSFHRSCIDLWLLRHADCPLCKRPICNGAQKAKIV